MKLKTNFELLSELPDHIKVKVLKNIKSNQKDKLPISENNIANALESSFEWDQTQEGFDYWYNIFDLLKRGALIYKGKKP